jgi:endoglucanase
MITGSRTAGIAAGLFLGTALFSSPCAQAQGAGYWHTSGSQILDANGKNVRIAGVNWYGFETTDEVVHGLYAQDYKTILSTIKALGYNTVRLPYSNQMVESPIVPTNITFANGDNSDLQGLNSLQIMDKIVAEAGTLGVRIILDNHRSEAGNSAEGNGLWYTSTYPESNWINDWKTLVTRYDGYTDGSGNPVVIGVDLRNEPHNATSGGSCWTGDPAVNGCPITNTAQNWPAAAERAASAVLAINPKMLIFVEGTDAYNNDFDWWGGNLEGARSNPVTLSVANQLVYSAHDYGPEEYGQSWFNSSTTPASLDAVWTKFWGYLAIDNVAPVWLGEFGTDNTSSNIENTAAGSEGQWFESLVNFLYSNNQLSWTYWALNGEDQFALLDSNYDATPVSSLKQQELATIQFSLSGGGSVTTPSCKADPSVPSGVGATSSSSSQATVHWNAVAAPANCTVAYSVYRSTTSGFTAAAANQVGTGLTTASFTDVNLSAGTTYFYVVKATDSYGLSAQSAQASVKTAAAGSGGACHIAYSVVNQWNTGFQAAITIQNTGSTPLTNWTVKWTFPNTQQVTNLWNATSTQSGETVTIVNESYNGSIAAGASYTGVGFTANYSGSNSAPGSFTLNGVACH